MTRIVCIQEIELKPGVTEAEFEQAMRAFLAHESTPGCRDSLIKGDRHTRQGKYGLLSEFESAEARERFFSSDGETEEWRQFLASHPEWVQLWEHVMTLVVQPYPSILTDYQILVTSP